MNKQTFSVNYIIILFYKNALKGRSTFKKKKNSNREKYQNDNYVYYKAAKREADLWKYEDCKNNLHLTFEELNRWDINHVNFRSWSVN